MFDHIHPFPTPVRKTSLLTIGLLGATLLLTTVRSGTISANAGIEGSTSSKLVVPDVLPPIPTGMPGDFNFGLFNASINTVPASIPWDFRYQYLSGGVNTGDGWATWNANGGYATNYINDAQSRGMIPAFQYYQILQSEPYYDEYQNMQNAGTMYDYFTDWALLMTKCEQAGGTVVVMLEADLTGVMQQLSTGDDASTVSASVASSGYPQASGYPNNFKGMYQAMLHIRDITAPSVLVALDVSAWGAGDDVVLALRDDPSYNWQAHADHTAAFLNSIGPGFDLLSWNPADRDAAWYQNTQGSNRWWDTNNITQPTFNTMGAWIGRIVQETNKRVILWQVPNGNRVYRSENNTDGHWQDNRTEYFLNPTNGRQHIQDWANLGVLGIWWGAGVGSQSHYFDYKGDGITNPPPINGNNETALYADDDGGYIRVNSDAYYSGGTIPLPGGSGATATSTSTSSAPTATRTPTGPVPTATQTATGTLPTATRTRTPTRTATNAAPTATHTNTVVPATPPPSGPLPWLKTQGGRIVRADTNQPVELRGVNLLRNEWAYPSMDFEREAIPQLAYVWHANFILHDFASNPVVDGDSTYLAVLDEYQRLAEQNGMYIIFCYYYPTINGDQPPNPDVDPHSQQALVDLVQRYKDKSNVMFMLQAEPHSDTWNGTYYHVTWNTLRPTYDNMITAMRAVDNPSPEKHLILASGDGYGRDISPVVVDEYGVGYVDPITADGGQNIVYSSHPYDPPSEWSYFLPVADAGYPVLVTEFGTGGQMSQSDTETLMNTLNSGNRHIGWTAWIFDSEGCPCLLTGDRTDFIPSDPYGVSVRDRIISEATRFGGGGGGGGSPTITPTNTPTRTNTPTGTWFAPTSTRTPTGTWVPPTNTPTTCTISFTDVHTTDYFYNPVQYLFCNNIVSGYADNTFRPYNTTSRAQLTKMIALAEDWGLSNPSNNTFKDVQQGSTFYRYVETAAQHSLISGYSCGGSGEPCDGQSRPYFRPNNDVSRAQVAKIIVLAENWLMLNPVDNTFMDIVPNSTYYRYVETAAQHSLISGYPCGGSGEPCDGQNRPYFRPNNSATRGQVAKMVYWAITGP